MSAPLFRWIPFLVNAFFIPCNDLSATDLPSPAVVPSSAIIVNPQATYSFLGNGYLGRALGLDRNSALQLGGFLIPEFDWLVSGGVEPDSAYGSLALGLHAKVDLQKALGIPGATWGVEFLESTGGDNNQAAGTVQLYTNMDGAEPRNRQEMMQLWWHQRLFDDKLLVQVGKMNGTGIFNTVLNPVIVDTPWMQNFTISNLIMTFLSARIPPSLAGSPPITTPPTGPSFTWRPPQTFMPPLASLMAMVPQGSRPEWNGCPPSTNTFSISPRWAIPGVWVTGANPGGWAWGAGGRPVTSILPP
jgi:hypothetical protein